MLGTVTISEFEQASRSLDEAAQRLYAHHRQITPYRDWVLVRVLPKEQMRNGLYLPDKIQNKPLHEGIVLATWRPYTEEKTAVDEAGRRTTRVIQRRSHLTPGQHVLFEHWTGVPYDGEQKHNTNFRLVRETWNKNEGGVIGLVDYEAAETHSHRLLNELLASAVVAGTSLSTGDAERLAGLLSAQIDQRFQLLDRERTSVTLSGR